jgi:hypothetical protein
VPALYFYLLEVKSLSVEAALFAIALTSLLTAVLELPTGVLADRVSRKLSIQVGVIAKFFSYIILIFAPNFAVVLLSVLVKAIGKALVSGADESLMYDMLKHHGREKSFKQYMRSLKGWHLLQVVITVFIGAQLLTIDLSLPIWATALTVLVSFVFSFTISDVETTHEGSEKLDSSYLLHFKSAMKLIFSRGGLAQGLLFLTAGAGILQGVAVSNKDIYTPILEIFSADISLVANLVTVVFAAKLIGYFFPLKWIYKVIPGKWEIPIFASLYSLFILLLMFTNNIFFAAILVSIAVGVEGFYRPALNQLFNESIPSSYRSTLLSLVSLIKEIVNFALVALFGVFLAGVSANAAIGWVVTVSVTGTMMVLAYMLARQAKRLAGNRGLFSSKRN